MSGPAPAARRPRPVDTGFEGLDFYPGLLDVPAQQALLDALREGAASAPPYRPRMPRTGQPWSITQTNFGPLGWVSDERGYRYEPTHPLTGRPWPAIPPALLALWDDLAAYPAPPECCLVNIYRGAKAKMGLHQDRDEAATEGPRSLGLAGRYLPFPRRRIRPWRQNQKLPTRQRRRAAPRRRLQNALPRRRQARPRLLATH